jgi:glucokinase
LTAARHQVPEPGQPAGRDSPPAPVPALEIGGSHAAAALADLVAGTVVPGSRRRADLDPSGSAGEILDAVVTCGRDIPAIAGARWGVAIPGPFDYDRGLGMFAEVGKFEALYGADVRGALMAGLPGPPGLVTFLNDAEAFAWGEWLFGAAAGSERSAFLTLGTGIGSAFLAGGVIRRSGAGVPPEGRADLLRIAGQPLEEVVSTRAIERQYAQRAGAPARGAAEVAALARAGNQVAASVLGSAFRHLGAALRPYLAAFAPQVLVVGGAITGSWDLVGPALEAGLSGAPRTPPGRVPRSLRDLRLLVAANPADAALLGAAAYAQRRTGQSP